MKKGFLKLKGFKGSYDSANESLLDNYDRHGSKIGASSPQQYLNKAREFAKSLSDVKEMNCHGYTEYVTGYAKNGKYIIFDDNKNILSFGSVYHNDYIMHQFLIVDNQFLKENTGKMVPRDELPGKSWLNIHADILLFIWNTLKIMKCYNYKNEKEVSGLLYDSRTYIHNDQLEVFLKIIKIWLSFIELAGEKIKINQYNEEYDKTLVRDELQSLYELVQDALLTGRNILHLGI